eukprot:TRINITY_DN1533_c0_g2_i10.p1 TRINITY_DN1533_c0_g2~~TRINITY_DN1533_c0_g2_i10.p1  ORF type:complete len:432 (-),score=74.53 TRINITY_DN1533_c0_g2_i10:1713-3008(-)
MIRRPPRSTLSSSSAASDVYKRQYQRRVRGWFIYSMDSLLQLGFDAANAAVALSRNDGNVESAVTYLLDHQEQPPGFWNEPDGEYPSASAASNQNPQDIDDAELAQAMALSMATTDPAVGVGNEAAPKRSRSVHQALDLLASNSGSTFERSSETLQRILRNVAAQPTETKFHRIRMTKDKLKADIVDVKGAKELLLAIGFREEGEFLVLPEGENAAQVATSGLDALEARRLDVAVAMSSEMDTTEDGAAAELPSSPSLQPRESISVEFERAEAEEVAQAEVQHLNDFCAMTGSSFVDPEFPPTNLSLYNTADGHCTWECLTCRKRNPLPPDPTSQAEYEAQPTMTCAHCGAAATRISTMQRPQMWVRPADIRDDVTLQKSTVPWVVFREDPREDDVRQVPASLLSGPHLCSSGSSRKLLVCLWAVDPGFKA